ncbi:PREDICTED: protein RKD5-like [Camelina sativa]|uniref:Protein RKD5-like n=1 Tax=Camelina sativa TaxID=90675 RepID=A0ABM1QRF6_CAMSA|nr:PREDICTED: protein RKD5-like [Camelina sativa]
MAHSLTSLAIFQSLIRKEAVRSLHVYGSVEIEREFLFESESPYVEKEAKPLFLLEGSRRPEISEGSVFGTWRCIFLFRFNHPLPRFPTLLCPSRNPKLEDIPNLANDLKFISGSQPKTPSKVSDQEQCTSVGYCKSDQTKLLKLESEDDSVRDCEVDQPKPPRIVLKQDLNCLPDSESESEESENEKTEHSESDENVKMLMGKRTPSKIVAGLSLKDLSKYFGLTIVEASRSLNVGLTVLKKKCREFGIPRWPHRKIKSLDSLIHDLQREAEREQENSEAAAMAVAKKQKKLETEKRNIVERPFMEIQKETKRFRQINFKKRHRASRAKKNQESLVSNSSST